MPAEVALRHAEGHQHQSSPSRAPAEASGRRVPQLAAGIGDPLVLSEVAQSGAEAADLLHVGLRHPPFLTVGQAYALQPAWGHSKEGLLGRPETEYLGLMAAWGQVTLP